MGLFKKFIKKQEMKIAKKIFDEYSRYDLKIRELTFGQEIKMDSYYTGKKREEIKSYNDIIKRWNKS